MQVKVNNEQRQVEMHDTAGQEDYDRYYSMPTLLLSDDFVISNAFVSVYDTYLHLGMTLFPF